MRLPALLLVLVTACAGLRSNNLPEAPAAVSVKDMMDSTVQVHVKIKATLFTEVEDEKTKTSSIQEEEIEEGWVGSGVVYDKDQGLLGPTKSRFLSANHVLETPEVGSMVKETVNFFGMEIDLGIKRIDSVEITITTRDQRTCDVKVLKLGVDDSRDVATGEANCDAGRVAKIASSVPAYGEKVFISGHPAGVPLPLVTEGYVSGWYKGYLLTSTPAWGGNSGGPVFYNGEVIGLLVRGSRTYPHITLTTPLSEVLKRIAETQ